MCDLGNYTKNSDAGFMFERVFIMAVQATPRMTEAEKQALLQKMMGNADAASPPVVNTSMPLHSSGMTMAQFGTPLTLIERLAPLWGVTAGKWVAKQDKGMRVASGVVGVLMLLIGLFLLIGGGYTSIQGVRVPLGLTLQRIGSDIINPEAFPALGWWLLPFANNVIQIFSKHISGLKTLWRPSIIYDTTTTAVYMTIGVMAFLAAFDRTTSILIAAFVATAISLFIVVQAEQITFAALCVIRGSVKRKA